MEPPYPPLQVRISELKQAFALLEPKSRCGKIRFRLRLKKTGRSLGEIVIQYSDTFCFVLRQLQEADHPVEDLEYLLPEIAGFALYLGAVWAGVTPMTHIAQKFPKTLKPMGVVSEASAVFYIDRMLFWFQHLHLAPHNEALRVASYLAASGKYKYKLLMYEGEPAAISAAADASIQSALRGLKEQQNPVYVAIVTALLLEIAAVKDQLSYVGDSGLPVRLDY
jgi:hypothetical protein